MRDHAEARAAMTDILQNSGSSLAGQEAPQNLKFEREDWSLFRTVEGLQQKAGVREAQALPAGAEGAGRQRPRQRRGSPRRRAPQGQLLRRGRRPRDRRHTAKRLRASSASPARWSRPSCCGCRREALSATACASSPVLFSPPPARSSSSPATPYCASPERDGTTTVVSVKAVKFPVGTRVEISFGPAIPSGDGHACHGRIWPCRLAGNGRPTPAKSRRIGTMHPQFHELLYASGNTPVRELIAELDGCTGGKAGEIVAAARSRPVRSAQARHPASRPRSCSRSRAPTASR